VYHSLKCNSCIGHNDSFKSNAGSDYDGEQYSLSPQNKNEARIEHEDLKSCDDEDNINPCCDNESFEEGDPDEENTNVVVLVGIVVCHHRKMDGNKVNNM